MAVVTTWKKIDFVGKWKVVHMKMTYGAADTTITCNTGLKIIEGFNVSPTSVTAKPVDYIAVSGGTVTITVNAPGVACYLFLTAYGVG